MDYSILREIAGITYKCNLLSHYLTIYNFSFLNEKTLDFFQSHSFYELIFSLSGSLDVDIAQKVVTIHEKEFLYVGPQEQRKLKIYPDKPIQCASLSFNFSDCPGNGNYFPLPWLKEEKQLFQNLQTCSFQISSDFGEIQKEFESICHCLKQNLAGTPSKLKNHLALLLIDALQSLSGNQVRASSDYHLGNALVNKAIRVNEYVQQNFTDNITVQSAAQALNYSPRQLQRIVMDYYSVSFSNLVMQYRIAYAKSLLGMTDSSMEAVAEKSGFQNIKSFEKNFNKRVGITPSSFKKIFGKFSFQGKGENNGFNSNAIFHRSS